MDLIRLKFQMTSKISRWFSYVGFMPHSSLKAYLPIATFPIFQDLFPQVPLKQSPPYKIIREVFPQHSPGVLGPGLLLFPTSREVAKMTAFMKKILWVTVWDGGGRKCFIPFKLWVGFLSCEFLFDRAFSLISAGFNIKRLIENFVAIRPS